MNGAIDRVMIRGPRLFLCLNEKSFRKALNEVQAPDAKTVEMFTSFEVQGMAHSYSTDDGPATIVCIRNWEKTEICNLIELLAHEATHVWQNFAAYIDEEVPSIEFEAYSIGNITKRLFRSLIEQTVLAKTQSPRQAAPRTRRKPESKPETKAKRPRR